MSCFSFKFQDVPLLSRMDAVMEYVIDEYETLYDRTVSEEECEILKNRFMGMYVTRDLYEIYNWLLEEAGYPTLPERSYEKRTLPYEDVYPMLYLKYRLQQKTSRQKIKHLVIDEMQDYSYLQYYILKQLFSCNMTILGDRAQTMDDREQDVLTIFAGHIWETGKENCDEQKLSNTMEIAAYAGAITGIQDLELFERHGKEVSRSSFLKGERMRWMHWNRNCALRKMRLRLPLYLHLLRRRQKQSMRN